MSTTSKQRQDQANKAPHARHRERLRRKWQTGSRLEKHEFLELMLFSCISRKNTNEIAHALLDRFGSLRGVLQAPEQELLQVRGVGPKTVCFLKLSAEMIARYLEEGVDTRRILRSRGEVCEYLRSLFVGCSEERVYLLLFHQSGRLLACEQVGEGFSSISEVSLKRINQLAVHYDAASAMLAHNHPDGLLRASVQDVRTTEQIREALSLLGVALADHFVVANDRCVSVFSCESEAPFTQNSK